jgi:hypothetical protein
VRESGLPSGICGELQALGATLIDRGEHVAPEKRLITDDSDNAIDGQGRRDRSRDSGWCLTSQPYRRDYRGNDELLDHR